MMDLRNCAEHLSSFCESLQGCHSMASVPWLFSLELALLFFQFARMLFLSSGPGSCRTPQGELPLMYVLDIRISRSSDQSNQGTTWQSPGLAVLPLVIC